MQIWLFFEAGCGGDGLCNLLEHSLNVRTIDGQEPYWRVHRIVDGAVKFYAPTPDTAGCFRNAPLQPFRAGSNRLNLQYANLVGTNQNCIVTSHDVTLDYLDDSDQKDILCRDQIKILLKNHSVKQMINQSMIKNLQSYHNPELAKIDLSRFDFVVSTEEITISWNAFQNLAQNLGLVANHDKYLEFLDICSGGRTYLKHNRNVEIYQSHLGRDGVTYQLIDVWQTNETTS
jgi:hypothetical protein